MIDIQGKELIGLYLFLTQHQEELDINLALLLTKIEKTLYSKLSINDFEHLEYYYNNDIDLITRKGSSFE
jgi:hypothetical protein